MWKSFSTTDVYGAIDAGTKMEGASKAKVAMRLQGLWKTYPGGAQPAVRDLSLDVYDGEIVTLLGPSGCGKTTTLRLVAGLEVPDAGDIFFGDRAVVITSRRLFDFVGRTLLFKGKVQTSNPSGQMAIALEGAPDCVVFGRNYNPGGIKTGEAVYVAVRPEDVEILPARGSGVPSGMIGGMVQAALFIGERIEYQIEVDGQGVIVIYGERHEPVEEGSKVWLKPRLDGHSAWPSDWSDEESVEVHSSVGLRHAGR